MGKFSLQTRIYIISSLFGGAILFAIFVSRWNWQASWIQTIVLSVLAVLTLLFKIEGSTDRTHYDITFLIYGCALILYGAPVAVVVILVAHIIEWIWHRYPWFIQSFNIASYIIVAVAANMVYEFANPTRSMATWQGAISMLAALAFFTLLNHLMVGLIVWLARGENFVQSGIFRIFPLMLDWVLLCMGAGVAIIWTYNPFAVILILLPLYLIYRTLRVPALERQVETDPKTGLFNPKYYKTALEAEIDRANRFDRPMTVVMADLDLLRIINNTYGHLAGDEVLIGVARIMKEMSREYDVVARFGGEEFAILLPETTPEEAYAIIQLMRSEIEKAQFVVPTSVTPIKATMSFGIAGREAGLDGDGMTHNADMALYHSKLNGRNRVFIYSNEGFKDLFQSVLKTGPHPVSPVPDRDQPAAPAEDPRVVPDSQPVEKQKAAPVRPVVEEKPGQGSRKNAKPWVDVYILDLTLGAIGLFLLTILGFPPVNWFGVLVFTILVAVTEWWSIDIYIRDTSVSTSAVPLIAGIILFGPVSAIFMSITIAAVAFIKHKSPFSRFIFNFSNQLLAVLICILIIQLTGSSFTDFSLPVQLLVSSIAAMLVYWSTSFFISIGISINFGEPVLRIWKEQFSWLAPYYLGMGVIAFALIFGYLHYGMLGTVIILVPLFLLRISQKQFIDRTKDTVNELNKKNKILEEHSREIARLNNGLLDTLADVIDLRDPYIFGHSQQVTLYAVMIAQVMGLSPEQIEVIRKASLMHDLGKLGINVDILSKPSGLTEEEYEIVKQHVTVGAKLLRKNQSLLPLISIVLHHHERYDGKGYPDRLKGTEIPLEARIVCLADSIEAMASDRLYRHALNFDEILEEVRHCSGSQFDPEVVKAFEQIVKKTGSSMITNVSNPLLKITNEG
jgi:diguanylate cyclase (GGDEF)-like protein/putative nucleotidyltransferase with HDIG domain